MVLHEPFRGELIYKFPGGGLEFGEGTRDCVSREFLEELNLKVVVQEHLYTQDFFVQNAFDSEEQILLIYYTASITASDLAKLQVNDPDIEEVLWIDVHQLDPTLFILDADKVAIEVYKKKNFES